jgi:hypothetical protein
VCGTFCHSHRRKAHIWLSRHTPSVRLDGREHTLGHSRSVSEVLQFPEPECWPKSMAGGPAPGGARGPRRGGRVFDIGGVTINAKSRQNGLCFFQQTSRRGCDNIDAEPRQAARAEGSSQLCYRHVHQIPTRSIRCSGAFCPHSQIVDGVLPAQVPEFSRQAGSSLPHACSYHPEKGQGSFLCYQLSYQQVLLI